MGAEIANSEYRGHIWIPSRSQLIFDNKTPVPVLINRAAV